MSMQRLIIMPLFFLLLFLFKISTVIAQTPEQILKYDSYIIVNKDASLDITENIRVYANQYKIRHGLVRLLPTNYIDSYGIKHHTIYQLKEVLINNQPSPYHTTNQNNQFGIYAGDKETTLGSGEYVYTFKYQVKNGVNFLKDQDELYWNITGNGWDFPIVSTTATIQLPDNIAITNYNAFTGKLGKKEKNYTVIRQNPSTIQFTSTHAFSRGQGLTVAVSWPKGLIQKPSLIQTIRTSPDQTFSIEITIILILYYLLIWTLYGRRPRRGPIIPLFTPPAELSPALMRYIYQMGFDVKIFTAAVVSMATKRFLSIDNTHNTVTITQTTNDTLNLSDEEKIIANHLFTKSSSIKLLQDNYQEIHAAKSSLKSLLTMKYKNVYFIKNTLYLIPGWLFGLISFLITFYSVKDNPDNCFALAWLSFWAIFCGFIFVRAVENIKVAFWDPRIYYIFSAIMVTLLSLSFIIAGVVQLIFLFDNLPLVTLGLFVFTVMINISFIYLMKIPTLAGRKVMDQIEGFKMFLNTTDRCRLAQQQQPKQTPELFEKLLPYAIALNVEGQWSKQFAETLTQADQPTTDLQPIWYTGSTWTGYNTSSNFFQTLNGALSSALALSSVSTSSSASGGGSSGSSGGGGGGGGGGGW